LATHLTPQALQRQAGATASPTSQDRLYAGVGSKQEKQPFRYHCIHVKHNHEKQLIVLFFFFQFIFGCKGYINNETHKLFILAYSNDLQSFLIFTLIIDNEGKVRIHHNPDSVFYRC
jgi:hypothetical protein